MNWDRLAGNPDFQELFESGEAAEELRRLEHRLVTGSETDSHAVGHLRGRIAGIRWVYDYVQKRAASELTEDAPPPKEKSKLTDLFNRKIH